MGISMNDYEQYRERYQFLAKGRRQISDAKTEASYDARANSEGSVSYKKYALK